MNSEIRSLYAACAAAFPPVAAAALTLVVTAALLARAGIPFTAAYTASIAACALGTYALSRSGRTWITFPSPAIISWLVYEEIIARGTAWQEMLGIAAIISIAGAFLMRTRYAAVLTEALPPIIRTGLVLGLGLALLMTAVLYARILLPSPWALTMGGTLGDPLTYYTLMGILLSLLLYAMRVSFALPLSMAVIGILTWVEGFWELPAAPFFVPDISAGALALTLPQGDPIAALTTGLTLLLALTAENAAVLAAERECTKGHPLARIFAVSGGTALFGAFPLTVTPLSLMLPSEEQRRIAGIPQTAFCTVLFFLMLLPCAPLLASFADFPAVPAVSLAMCGLLLLVRGLRMLRGAADIDLREGAVMTAFILAAYDIKAGLTLALLTWTLLTTARGEHVPHTTWGLTALFIIFFLLKWTL